VFAAQGGKAQRLPSFRVPVNTPGGTGLSANRRLWHSVAAHRSHGRRAHPAKRFWPMATVRRTRRKTDKVAASATVVRLRNRASAGEAVVRSLAGAVDRELRAKHAAGLPYSTLNARGEVVFVHPDGTVRTGRAGDSPAVA